MMMSQMEIMEKGRRLVSPILASTTALVQSFQLPVQWTLMALLVVVMEEEHQHPLPLPLRMEDITAEVEAILLILHKDMWKLSRGG
jgi:hypothetical protein